MSQQQQSRINFHEETEQVLIKLIQLYQSVSEQTQQMACHFLRDDVAIRGFEMLLWRRSDKLRVGVCKVIRFVNKRGGRVQFTDIPKPTQTEFKNMLEGMQYLLNCEKQILQASQDVFAVAQKHQDCVTMEYVEKKLMYKQTTLIKKIAESLITLQKNGEPLGDLMFEKHILTPVVAKETIKLMTKTPYVYPRFVKDTIVPVTPLSLTSTHRSFQPLF